MPKQKKRLSRKQKKQKFKTVKAWLDEKDKKRRRQEAEELGKMTVDYRITNKAQKMDKSIMSTFGLNQFRSYFLRLHCQTLQYD